MKYTVAPKKILQTALLWHPENIDLQHSFAQSMAEMGEHESYQKAHNTAGNVTSANYPTNIFSVVNFLKSAAETLDHTARRDLAQHWEARQLTPETSTLWADHISISQSKIGQSESVIYLQTGEITLSDASCFRF